MNQLRQINWRTGALILCLAISLALSIAAFQASRRALPDWVEIQEGPVAHGVDKFYRNAYFKGNIETAGDLTVAGSTTLNEAAGTITATQVLTPAATFYQLDPSEEITITLAACSSAGQTLILYNANVTHAVNISPTNLLPASGLVISQNDTFLGLCNGTAWLKVHLQDN